jgi:hypothetical protein
MESSSSLIAAAADWDMETPRIDGKQARTIPLANGVPQGREL